MQHKFLTMSLTPPPCRRRRFGQCSKKMWSSFLSFGLPLKFFLVPFSCFEVLGQVLQFGLLNMFKMRTKYVVKYEIGLHCVNRYYCSPK